MGIRAYGECHALESRTDHVSIIFSFKFYFDLLYAGHSAEADELELNGKIGSNPLG